MTRVAARIRQLRQPRLYGGDGRTAGRTIVIDAMLAPRRLERFVQHDDKSGCSQKCSKTSFGTARRAAAAFAAAFAAAAAAAAAARRCSSA